MCHVCMYVWEGFGGRERLRWREPDLVNVECCAFVLWDAARACGVRALSGRVWLVC